ncbi:tyrosine recombinase XerC [Frankia sp. R43]|uniref:site-specific integrase n=1 Tax=Frankia sp. R43 TaxID=269536 RepID=UPI000A8BB2FD|nr:tyrosine-type recombinase/integrase [Frankia sp. R43]
MKITAKHRCGCRSPETGQKYPAGTCPDRNKRGHGFYAGEFRVPAELVALAGTDRVRFRGDTRKEAEDDGDRKWAAIRAGQQHIGKLTVSAYLDDWLGRKNALRPTTRARYGQFIRLHLVPFLGEMPLSGLRAEHIDAALKLAVKASQERRGRPVGPATVKDVLEMLRTALNDAVRQRKLDFNPANGVELASYSTPEVEPWEAAEVGRFLDEAADDRLAAAYELIALHGLRRGEVCGATWSGLDEAARVLVVRQQITRSGASLGVWAPKTKSGRRKVDLAEVTVGSLGVHRLRQDEERDAVGPTWDNGTLPDEHGKPVHLQDLIFTHPSGRHLAPEYLTRQMQRIARRVGLLGTVKVAAEADANTVVIGTRYRPAAGVWTLYRDREPVGQVTVLGVAVQGSRSVLHLAEPLPVDLATGDEIGERLLSPKRLHDLRHGSASIMLGEGIDITTVSKILGHSSTSMTGNTYAHLLRSTGQAAAETVAAAIPRKTVRPHHVRTSGAHGGGIVKAGGVPTGRGAVQGGRPLSASVDLTHHNKNRLILVQGPEIAIRPVSTRPLARGDAQ